MTRRRKPAAQDRPKRRVLERASAPADPHGHPPKAGPGAPGDRGASVVDLSRVVEARRRIASGWYDRSDVRDSLVEAVLEEIRGH